jgi:hypothetical protein
MAALQVELVLQPRDASVQSTALERSEHRGDMAPRRHPAIPPEQARCPRASNRGEGRIQISYRRSRGPQLHLSSCHTSTLQPWVGSGIRHVRTRIIV